MGVILCGSPIFVQSGVWNFKVGDRVWGAIDPFKGGCQVEYTAVNEVHISAIYPALFLTITIDLFIQSAVNYFRCRGCNDSLCRLNQVCASFPPKLYDRC